MAGGSSKRYTFHQNLKTYLDHLGEGTRLGAVLTRIFNTSSTGYDAPSATGVTLSTHGDIAVGGGNALLAVLGEPLDAMVQNLGETDNGYVNLGFGSNKALSQGFTTGSNAGGYELQGIGINIEGSSSSFPDGPTSVSVAVHADSSGQPGAKLFDLVSPTEFAAGHSFFEAPPGTLLTPNTSYVLFWRYIDGTWSRLQKTLSDGEDSGALTGFSIANVFYRGADLNNLSANSDSNALEIAVYGEEATTPTVTAVALTSDPGLDSTYGIGDSVAATVTFDEAVDITGAPQLELDFAGAPKTANCAAATNTTTMVCSRTVAENDLAPNGIAIAANKLTFNGGAITLNGAARTAVLTHSAVAIDPAHKVDGVRPTLVTTGNDAPQTSADGTQVILTFSEDIGSVTILNIGVTVGGVIGYIQGATATVSGRTVTLTLASFLTILYGEDVKLSLGLGSVRDTVGNRNLAHPTFEAVTNNVRRPPAVITGVAITSDPGMDGIYATNDDIEVTVTFDQAVAVTGKPRILLQLGGGNRGRRWAEYASGSGTAALVFSYTVLARDESATNGIGVGIVATASDNVDLNGGTITVDATGEDASLSYAQLLSDSGHRVNWALPTLSDAVTSTDGTKVLLTFSEDLGGMVVTHSLFTVKVAGTAVALSGSEGTVSGRVVTLTLATALTSATQVVTVSYAKATTGTSGVQDLVFNDADSFTDQMVTNRFGLPAVTFVEFYSTPNNNTWAIGEEIGAEVTISAAVDITGTPQLELDFAGTPKAAACDTDTNTTAMVCFYTVAVGDSAPNGVAIAANKLTLNGGTITATGSTTINAVLAHAAVAIDAGQKVDGIRPTLVTTGSEAPTTSTDGTKVILTFSEDIGSVTPSLITIEGNSVALPTSGDNIVGPTVELTLTTALTDSAASLTVALAVGAVTDAVSNDNAALAATPVINAITDDPVVSSVALTSVPNNNTWAIGEEIEATVTFSAAVDITGTPQLELDFAGTPKPAGCVAATNTTTMACRYTVAVNDSAPNGIAIAANKLTLNGGTITATGSTTLNADLDHGAVAIDADQKVDGIRPTLVTTGANAPTTSADGTKVILTFSEDIGSVTPSLITIEGNSVALPTSGDNIVGPTVELTLTTALTDSAASLTVALAVGAVTDAVSNDNLAVPATTVINAVGSAPTVTGVALTSVPNNNTWAIGEEIEATVTFSAAVDITGTPQLELDFDGTPKAANCTAATNTTTMACRYTVAVNDSAPNGIAIAANKLTLNGGTMTATGSTTLNADLDHGAVAIDADQKVDGIRPTLVTTGANAPTTSTDGTKVILTFSEDIGSVTPSLITIEGNSVALPTSGDNIVGPTVELTLTTALTDSAASLTVALAVGAVTDAVSNDNLAVPATTVINAVGSAPTVTGVALTSVPNNNTWAIGEEIEATVTFSAAVDITGTPQLELDFDGTPKPAGCVAATNTTTMACRYTVAVNDSAPNGIAIAANKLTLNGGTITATGSTTLNADLDHGAVAIDAGHKVDGIRPTLVTTGNDAPTTSPDGMQVILTFSETIGSADRTKITIMAGTTTLPTTAARAAETTVVVDLTTAVTSTTPALSVALAADAVEDTAGNGNLAVAATSVTTALGAPNVPQSLSATPGNRQVMLGWVQPSGGAEVTHYEYEQDGSGTWISTGGTAPSYTVTGLTNGQTYTFRVRAVNSAGASAASGSRTATPTTTEPEAPTGLSATVSDQEVDLIWTAPASNGGATITHYEYEQDGSGTWISTGGTTTSYTVTGLTNGQSYTFRVRAVNRVGAGLATSSQSATPTSTVVAPDTPSSLSATPGNRQVMLSWVQPSGGAALTHYEYEQDGSGTWTSTGGKAPSYTVTGSVSV